MGYNCKNENCKAILSRPDQVCRFCEGRKFGSAVKKLFFSVVDDVKNAATKARKIRITTK